MVSYTVDVEYIVYRDTNVPAMDQQLIALAKEHGGEWSASEIGPFNTCFARVRRDNAFHFEEFRNVKDFISCISAHKKYILDTVYVNVGKDITHKLDNGAIVYT